MKKWFIRLASVALLAFLGLWLTGCGKSAGNADNEEDKESYIYIGNEVDVDVDLSSNCSVNIFNADGKVIDYLLSEFNEDYTESEESYHHYELASNKDTKVSLEGKDKEEYISNAAISGDKLFVIFNRYDEATGESLYSLASYDLSGKLIAKKDISDAVSDNGISYISNVSTDKNSNVVIAGDSSVVGFDANGKVAYTMSASQWIEGLFKSEDGEIYVTAYFENGYEVRRVDTDKKTLEKTPVSNVGYGNWSCIGGDEFICSDDNCAKKINVKTGESKILWRWFNTDYVNCYPKFFWQNDDGTYSFVLEEYNETGENLKTVTLKKEVETAENKKTIITYGCVYLDYNIKKAISAFNKSNNKYRINVIDYESEYGWEDGQTKFNTDVTADKFDIIDASSSDVNLASKGALEDLYPFLDKDPEINREAFMDGILKAAELDGKLYYLSNSFSVYSLIADASIVGNRTSWTVSDMLDVIEKNPDKEIMTATSSDVLYYLLMFGADNYLDFGKGKCDFDNDDFKKVLEIASRFPEEYNTPENYSMFDEIAKGEVIMAPLFLYDFNEYSLYNGAFGGNSTIIGFPSESGTGNSANFSSSLGIAKKSKVKEGAWEFIKYFVQYTDEESAYGIPSLKVNFDERIKELKAGRDNAVNGGGYIEGMGAYTFGNLSDEDIDAICEVLKRPMAMVHYDEKVFEIIDEECAPFFKGEKSADETAKIIQSRISIYLSENN